MSKNVNKSSHKNQLSFAKAELESAKQFTSLLGSEDSLEMWEAAKGWEEEIKNRIVRLNAF